MNKKEMDLNIPDEGKPRVVIVGGGFGGLNVVKHVNTTYFQVVLLDRYNYHTFQPLLYQVATAGLEPDSIAGPHRKILIHKKLVYFRMLKVTYIDTKQNTIYSGSGELQFDHLVIANGAKVNFFDNENLAKHAFPLKQVTHALDLRSHIFQQFEKLEFTKNSEQSREIMNFVVVGAGPTGVEICGALVELKKHILPKDYPQIDFNQMNIYLIEGLDRVLPLMSEKTSRKAYTYLNKSGVNIILKCLTEDYNGHLVKLSNGQNIRTTTLIWAAGVKGNLIKGFDQKSIQKNKLLVNETNHVFKIPEKNEVYKKIMAIGDIASLKSDYHPAGLPGLAPVAIQQGKNVARNLNRFVQGKPLKPFRYKNKGVLATVGRSKAVADLPYNIRLYGFLSWIVWMIVHLWYLIGFRNKAVVFANWAWNYFTFDRGIRLILRPSTKQKDILSKQMKEEMNKT